jgi:hypothetical protein
VVAEVLGLSAVLFAFITKHQAGISLCVLFTLLVIVIHPDFDLPNARAKRGISAAMFMLPLVGQMSFVLLITERSFSAASGLHLTGNTPQLLLPLLC